MNNIMLVKLINTLSNLLEDLNTLKNVHFSIILFKSTLGA